jgi:hypothetical protein
MDQTLSKSGYFKLGFPFVAIDGIQLPFRKISGKTIGFWETFIFDKPSE